MLAACLLALRACVLFTPGHDTHFGLFSSQQNPLSHPSCHQKLMHVLKQITVEPPRGHCEPLKAPASYSEKPQKATTSHSKALRNATKATFVFPIPCSRVALLAHRPWSRGYFGQLFLFCARPPHRKQQQHPTTAHTNHGHTHRGTATVPLILPAHVVQSCS